MNVVGMLTVYAINITGVLLLIDKLPVLLHVAWFQQFIELIGPFEMGHSIYKYADKIVSHHYDTVNF